MVKDNRTWVHPNAIRRGEKLDSGRYLHYYRHWERFTLKMDDYQFIRWVASHNANNHTDDSGFEAVAKKLSEQGWSALTQEEQQTFSEREIKAIGVDKLQEGVSFEGWARLEGGPGRETITSFAVENDPYRRSRDSDDSYEKTFTKVRVGILSAEDEHPGSMWVWGESMRRLGRGDDGMGGEDALYVQFYMLPEKLKSLARDVAAQPGKPTLTLHAQGLLFRDEVDAALSEPWHSRDYVMIYDHHHRVILNSIRFEIQTGAATSPSPPGTDEGDTIRPPEARHTPAAPLAALIPDAVAKNLRGIKFAIWVLAAAIVVAVIIR